MQKNSLEEKLELLDWEISVMSLNLRRILVVSLPCLNAAQNATTATMQMTEAVADVFKNQRLVIPSSLNRLKYRES